jgi:ketosteroid isomerase-like protein
MRAAASRVTAGQASRTSRDTADGDVTFVHGLARMGAVGQFSMWLRVTFGLRKRDGAWQITYEHESMPFYMDGFRAATDLEP